MANMTFSSVSGAHLTATDRRNVKALLELDGFVAGRAYQINGRKVYTLTPNGNGWDVKLVDTERDDFGRKVEYTYRSHVVTDV